MAPRQQIHAVAPRDTLDRVAFGVAFLLGAGGSVTLKLLGAHPFITAGYAALILCLYAVAAWAGGRIKIEPETIGDNCYYLGFLFTLTSLAFTLYQMAEPTSAGERPIGIPGVISGFGVALSSTIVGVFLRVFMMQLRPDFVAKDREVRADINKAYAEFKKNLSGVHSQMKAFATESVQLASERDERIRKLTESFVEDHLASLNNATEEVTKSFEKMFQEAFTRANQELFQSMVASTKESKATFSALITEIHDLKTKYLNDEEETRTEMAERRKTLLSELEGIEKKLVAQGSVFDEHTKITRRMADAISKRLVPALENLKKRLDNLPRTVDDGDAEFLEPEQLPDLEAEIEKPFTLKTEKSSMWRRK